MPEMKAAKGQYFRGDELPEVAAKVANVSSTVAAQ
jgi:hypothetical protein